MKTYQATATRDGKWWMITVAQIDGLTQARSLAESAKMARSLIAITLDASPDSFDVDLCVERVGSLSDVSAEVAAIKTIREQAAAEEREAATRTKELAKRLAHEGLTVRDIGSALGVTFQRAHQLVAAGR